jgi:hypothetical protein
MPEEHSKKEDAHTAVKSNQTKTNKLNHQNQPNPSRPSLKHSIRQTIASIQTSNHPLTELPHHYSTPHLLHHLKVLMKPRAMGFLALPN